MNSGEAGVSVRGEEKGEFCGGKKISSADGLEMVLRGCWKRCFGGITSPPLEGSETVLRRGFYYPC